MKQKGRILIGLLTTTKLGLLVALDINDDNKPKKTKSCYMRYTLNLLTLQICHDNKHRKTESWYIDDMYKFITHIIFSDHYLKWEQPTEGMFEHIPAANASIDTLQINIPTFWLLYVTCLSKTDSFYTCSLRINIINTLPQLRKEWYTNNNYGISY